jgi:hypothetical protein
MSTVNVFAPGSSFSVLCVESTTYPVVFGAETASLPVEGFAVDGPTLTVLDAVKNCDVPAQPFDAPGPTTRFQPSVVALLRI